MPFLKNIEHCLKYPLMWVMLLWALTLPGHEVAVYSFIMKGSVAEAASVLKNVPDEEAASSVKQQALQVFLDAKVSASVVLHPQQAVRCFLQLFTFAPPADEDLPDYAVNPAGAQILAHIFPVSILPNAP